MKKKIVIIMGIALVFALAGGSLFFKNANKDSKFRTDKISRGEIRESVMSTGTVNAVVTVLVGTQVSGTIKDLYVDYNSPVRKGQILAQIDPAGFQAQVEQARANLAAAEANVVKAQAALLDAGRVLERNRTLFGRDHIARSDLDTAETTEQAARAQVAVAKAQVQQAKASLDYAETNLRYTRIISPVDGTVISRNVDVGQTVAASFQTPTLFTIARDLTEMQIIANIDEADIGRVKPELPVEFSVDAYPDETFTGTVQVVRNAPVTVQNVVTYDVVVNVDNPGLKLKPGMTANVTIILKEKENILRVPNAALRFRPDHQDNKVGRMQGAGVWVLVNAKPERIQVKTGISDGNFTELIESTLSEGQEVIVAGGTNERQNVSRNVMPGFVR